MSENYARRLARSDGRALLPLIKGRLPTLKRAQRRIAEAVLDDPERFMACPISELAGQCGVSAGAIVMFCKSLGLKGLPAMKLGLARELSAPFLDTMGKSKSGNGSGTIMRKVFDGHIKALNDTVKLNPPEILDAAVKLLTKAHRTALFSIGLSYPVAYSLSVRMRFIGLPSLIEYDAHLQVALAAELLPGDVAIGVSVAGNTRETVECVRLAKSRGAKTICITNSIDSPLAQAADVRLYAAPSEVRYFQAPLTSRVTQLAVADALLAGVGMRRKRRAMAHLRRAEEHLLEHRLTVSSSSKRLHPWN